MRELKELIEAARKRLPLVDGLARHDAVRVEDGLNVALGALESSEPVEVASPPAQEPAVEQPEVEKVEKVEQKQSAGTLAANSPTPKASE